MEHWEEPLLVEFLKIPKIKIYEAKYKVQMMTWGSMWGFA